MDAVFEMISRTADGAFAVDREQTIVVWNRAAEQLLRLKSRDVLGKHCHEVLSGRTEEGRPFCRKDCPAMRRALGKRLVPARDLWVKRKGRADLCVNVSTFLVPSKWHDLSTLVHVFRDVTRQKRLEKLGKDILTAVDDRPGPRPAPVASRARSRPPTTDLTARELEVLRLLARGASTGTIAEELFISRATVRNHIQSILAKQGVHSRLEAVALGMRRGLV